ncbi:MAG: molybdopterin cofactor-binding domain-containing protein [Candidatus Eisenbacteria bacterium]
MYDSPYAFPAAEMTYAAVDAPTPIGPWRAVFSPSSVFARECFIDELAQTCDRDPVELRLDMLGANDASIPSTFEIGEDLVEQQRMRRVVETVARKPGGVTPHRPAVPRVLPATSFTPGPTSPMPSRSRFARVSLSRSFLHRPPSGLRRRLWVGDQSGRRPPASRKRRDLGRSRNLKSEITFHAGRARQSNYSDFPVAVMDETPLEVETHIVGAEAAAPNGLGEPTVCPFTPAVVNALSRLAGKRIRSLPVRAADVSSR